MHNNLKKTKNVKAHYNVSSVCIEFIQAYVNMYIHTYTHKHKYDPVLIRGTALFKCKSTPNPRSYSKLAIIQDLALIQESTEYISYIFILYIYVYVHV